MDKVVAYTAIGLFILSAIVAAAGIVIAFIQISRMDSNDNQNLKQ